MESKYIFSDFVYQDDTIYISKAFFNHDMDAPELIQYPLISLLSGAQSITLIRIVWLVFFSANAAFIAAIFAHHTNQKVLPVLLGVCIGFLTISADQVIFITGSHPMLALSFILASLFLFSRTNHLHGARLILSSVGVMTLLLLASFSSPTALLAPLALPIWLFVNWLASPRADKNLNEVLVAIGFCSLTAYIVFVTRGVGKYHYSGIEGWINITPSQVFTNLFIAFDKVVSIFITSSSTITIVYIFTVASIVMCITYSILLAVKCSNECKNINLTRNSSLWLLAINSLSMAALLFGPASITTSLVNRYLIGPSTLTAIFIFAIVLVMLEPIVKWKNICLSSVFILLAGLNIVRTWQIYNEQYAPYFRFHESVSELANNEQAKWSEDKQILILTSKNSKSPTSGYNHWSTWYLRLLTGKENLIGIIGSPADITGSPFVGNYRDFDSNYWKVVNGRSRRIRMIGFEKERPIYAYQENDLGQFEEVDYLAISDNEKIRYIAHGLSFNTKIDQKSLIDICNDSVTSKIFVWPGTSQIPFINTGPNTFPTQLENTMEFNGEEFIKFNLDLPTNSVVRIRMEITPAKIIEKETYSDVSPPMPVLTDQFAIYQHPHGFTFADRNSQSSWKISSENDSADLRFYGVEGCAIIVWFGNKVLGSIASRKVGGNWVIGRGFKQRYWAGTIRHHP